MMKAGARRGDEEKEVIGFWISEFGIRNSDFGVRYSLIGAWGCSDGRRG